MPKVIIDWDIKYKKAFIMSDFLDIIRAYISTPNNNNKIYKYKGYKPKYLNDFDSPITKTGRFDIGLFFFIFKKLKEHPLNFEIIVTDVLTKQTIQSYDGYENYKIKELSLPLRDYQLESIQSCLTYGNGITMIGTAGGKTLIMASLIETIRNNINKKFTTLLILPSNISTQTYREFISYGINKDEMSLWNGQNDYKKANIMIISMETLRAALSTFRELQPINILTWRKTNQDTPYEDYVKEFQVKEKSRQKTWEATKKQILKDLSDVELILIDEVHSLRKGNIICNIIDMFPTMHKFGFTGTMPSDLMDQWTIIGKIGPIVTDINSSVLRELNFISQVKIQILKLNHKNPPTFTIDINEPTKAYEAESSFLHNSSYRNNIICKLSKSFDKNALIMVDKIEHGENIYNILTASTTKKIFFIRGSMDDSVREEVKALIEKRDDIICIAMSRIFAVGVNIKNLHYVVFAQGGKAKVTLIQSIGRGLRLHNNKDCLIVIDIADNTNYSSDHLQNRIKYYNDEKIEFNTKELYE